MVKKYPLYGMFGCFESRYLWCSKKIFNIATNQSLNQEVPMFLHRGFRFISLLK